MSKTTNFLYRSSTSVLSALCSALTKIQWKVGKSEAYFYTEVPRMVLLLASGATVASVPDNLEEFLYRDDIRDGRSVMS